MAKHNCWLAMATGLVALGGCSSLLGLNKEPSLANEGPDDAAVDTATVDQMTVDMMTVDMDTGPCAGMNCGVFGCDAANHVCRPAKLWVFTTTGIFAANAFGGTDNTVRPTADGKCFTTASTDFPDRACTSDRTHAILTVNSADPIGSMATKFVIPTTVEVHRIDDDVLVFNNWNDLVGTQAPKAFFSSPARAPTDADGIGWTGFGGPTASNCAGWTTNLGTSFGVIAHTTSTKGSQATWLGPESVPCNTGPLQHLLCVCWSGGN